MNAQGLNLFIVDDSQLQATQLELHLYSKFGAELVISTFITGESVLKRVDQYTSIVILNSIIEGKINNAVLRAIKIINPRTKVFIHPSNEDVAVIIKSFRSRTTDYVIKGSAARKRIASLVYSNAAYPIKLFGKEFGINRYLGVFLLTFTIMGAIIYLALKYDY